MECLGWFVLLTLVAKAVMTTSDRKIIKHGIVCYEREDKYNCWICESDLLDEPHRSLIVASHDVNIDYYPDDCTQTYLLVDGCVYHKSISFYPEYITAYYEHLNNRLSDEELEDEEAINNTSWAALYDDWESFCKDPLSPHPLCCELVDELFYYCPHEFARFVPSNLKSLAWKYGFETSHMFREPDPPFDIDGYKHWFKIIRAFHPKAKKQQVINSFYPAKPKGNQRICILVFVDDVRKEIQWNHGKYGLTEKIFELIFG